MVFQEEIGERGTLCFFIKGTLHLQGFIQLVKPNKFTYITRRVTRKMHLELRRGTPREASDYCKKADTRVEGTFPYEVGELSFSGQRTDIEAFMQDLKAGHTMSQLTEEHPNYMMRSYGNVQKMRSNFVPQRTWKTKCCIIWGEPRVGKTFWAMNNFPSPYKMNDYDSTLFFAAYDPFVHKTVIFDEFNGNRLIIN